MDASDMPRRIGASVAALAAFAGAYFATGDDVEDVPRVVAGAVAAGAAWAGAHGLWWWGRRTWRRWTARSRGDPDAPRCLRCGAPMLRKVARRGADRGHEFWGCSRFPSCRGVRDI